MYKLIIFLALIVCAIASWDSNSNEHQKHFHGQHKTVGRPDVKLAKGHGEIRVEHGHGDKGAGHGHGDVRAGHTSHGNVGRTHSHDKGHGQPESVHHGGGTTYHKKEFERVKKGHQNKHLKGDKGKNHLRRVQSGKHTRR